MKITFTLNHGKPCWRINIQADGYRERLFFDTREKALAFAHAASGTVEFGTSELSKRAGNSSPSQR